MGGVVGQPWAHAMQENGNLTRFRLNNELSVLEARQELLQSLSDAMAPYVETYHVAPGEGLLLRGRWPDVTGDFSFENDIAMYHGKISFMIDGLEGAPTLGSDLGVRALRPAVYSLLEQVRLEIARN